MDRSKSLNDYFKDSNEVDIILIENKQNLFKTPELGNLTLNRKCNDFILILKLSYTKR
jgi:hypothetical protein